MKIIFRKWTSFCLAHQGTTPLNRPCVNNQIRQSHISLSCVSVSQLKQVNDSVSCISEHEQYKQALNTPHHMQNHYKTNYHIKPKTNSPTTGTTHDTSTDISKSIKAGSFWHITHRYIIWTGYRTQRWRPFTWMKVSLWTRACGFTSTYCVPLPLCFNVSSAGPTRTFLLGL